MSLYLEFDAIVRAFEEQGVRCAVIGGLAVASREKLVRMKMERGSGQDLADIEKLQGNDGDA